MLSLLCIDIATMGLLELDELQRMVPALRSRAGTKCAKAMMDMFGVTAANALNDRHECDDAARFCDEVLREDLGIREMIGNAHVLRNLPDGPFITVSNHPYGSMDGMMLVDLFCHLRPDYKVMVNKFLCRVKSMDSAFIPVVPVTADTEGVSAESISGVRVAYRHVLEGHPIGFFPAGAVSNFEFGGMSIRDREWQEPVMRLIWKMHLPVVPVRFFDRNTAFFYFLGMINWKIRVLRLPHELLNKKGKVARVGIGEVITPEMQDACKDMDEYTAMLRSSVYDMPMPSVFVPRAELSI